MIASSKCVAASEVVVLGRVPVLVEFGRTTDVVLVDHPKTILGGYVRDSSE